MAAALTKQDWTDHAKKLDFRHRAFINGKQVEAASGKTFDCINPANGGVLTAVAACDTVDVDRAVAAGRQAFEIGKLVTSSARRAQEGDAEIRGASDDAQLRAGAA